MPRTLTWTDPTNGLADKVQIVFTDTAGATPNTVLSEVAMGVRTAEISDTNAPAGRRFAVRGVNIDPEPDVNGPLSNIVQVPAAPGAGTTHSTDFGAAAAGAPPSTLVTSPWGALTTFAIVADAAYTGGKYLHVVAGADGPRGFRFVPPGDAVGDCLVQMRFKFGALPSAYPSMGIATRGAGQTGSSANAQGDGAVRSRISGETAHRIAQYQFDNGVSSVSALSTDPTVAFNTTDFWIWKVERVAAVQRQKLWVSGTAEPTGWMVEHTLASNRAPGFTGGILLRNTAALLVDTFSVTVY